MECKNNDVKAHACRTSSALTLRWTCNFRRAESGWSMGTRLLKNLLHGGWDAPYIQRTDLKLPILSYFLLLVRQFWPVAGSIATL